MLNEPDTNRSTSVAANDPGCQVLPCINWLYETVIFNVVRLNILSSYPACSFSDDYPHRTGINLEEGAAGKTDIDAIVVMDGISDVRVSSTFSKYSNSEYSTTTKLTRTKARNYRSDLVRTGARSYTRSVYSLTPRDTRPLAHMSWSAPRSGTVPAIMSATVAFARVFGIYLLFY